MAEDGHRVVLNVYDLSQGLARQLSTAFLGKAIDGIWHTGVVVYGYEYYFGGGIQHDPAGRTPYGTPVKVVDLGTTHVPQDVFEQYLQEISPRFTAESYSLLSHNCNNFSNEVAQFLVGATIPDYILQLPTEVMNSPMGALIMPMIQNLEATLRAGAVPQVPQFRNTPISQPSSLAATTTAREASVNGLSSNTDAVARAAKEEVKKSEDSNSVEPKELIAPSVKRAEAGKKPTTEAGKKPTTNGVAGDPLGDARSKLQEEISAEFQKIMCTGAYRASEAATLATRKVMERYKNVNVAAQQS